MDSLNVLLFLLSRSLFYVSLVVMFAIRNENMGEGACHLSLALPRFSLLATFSLGVIGITGIYMAWIQLHSLDSLFNTPYGNDLIIKLLAALPMVLLGAYHQIKLHKSIVVMAQVGNSGTSRIVIDEHHGNSSNNDTDPNALSKFDKTIKIESLIGIGVLLAASLLTVTSPPLSLTNLQSGTMTEMQGASNGNNYIQETMINGIDVRLSITPFGVGFNTFTVTLRDTTNDQQYPQNIKNVFLSFTNTDAQIGPIVTSLNKDNGVEDTYSITGR